MIPETMYDTSLETWELVLPEDEAGCESIYGCDSAASWRGIRPCCGMARTLCVTHKEREENGARNPRYTCAGCDAHSVIRWFRI